MGKGGGFLKGLEHSDGKYIILLDADFPTNTNTIIAIVNYLKSGYDLVLGSRIHKLSKLDPPLPIHRRLLSFVFNVFIRIFFQVHIHDSQCGVKGFKKEIFNIINPIISKNFMFDVEIIVKAHSYDLKIIEIPIYWKYKPGSKFRLPSDGVLAMKDLLSLWINLKKNTS